MIPLTLSFRGMKPSEAIESLVRRQASALERFYPRVMDCRVIVEQPHRRHRTGTPLHVRILLRLPGGREIVASRQPGRGEERHVDPDRIEEALIAHDRVTKSRELGARFADPDLAVRDAFRTAIRSLQDDVRRMQGNVKVHEPVQTGRIVRLLPDEECGFFATSDGREIYFHAHSVLDAAFADLAPGDEVRFVEEAGDEGPQASTVHVLAHHGT